MSSFVSLLPVAGCGLMMWFCMRGMRARKCDPSQTIPTSGVEIEELRTEVARLRTQLTSQSNVSRSHSLDH